MKTKHLLITLLALLVCTASSYATTYYSVASGNWNSSSTWSTSSGGSGGAGVPVEGDAVYIERGYTVTVTTNAAGCSSLQIGGTSFGTGNGTLSFSSGSILTVSGNVTLGNSSRTGSLNFSSGGILGIGGTFTVNAIGTFTPGTGTIEYNATGTQTVATTAAMGAAYNNLTLSGTSTKTVTGVTVNGILSMEGTATVSTAPTYGSAASLQYNTGTARTAGSEWITPFVATGGVIINNYGVITANAAKTINAGSSLTIKDGATLAMSTYLLTLNGNFYNYGTYTGTGGVTVTGTASQDIGKLTLTSGTFSVTKTSGTATAVGDLTLSAISLTGTGTFNLGAGLTHTATGTFTLSAGTLDGGSSLLRFSGSPTFSGGTFSGASGTVEYYASGVQTVAALPYNNLILSGSGAKSISSGMTTTGYLTLSGTASMTLAASNKLADGGQVTFNGGTLITGGYNETAGTLALANNSTLTFGAGSHSLNFTASNGVTWTSGKILTVTGWSGAWDGTGGTAGKLFVGSNAAALTASQLNQIRFYNGSTYYGATILSTGEVVPSGIINYYSKATGALNLTATWTSDITLASTISPANFTTANQVFNIRNNAAPVLSANWTVSGSGSKVILGDGTNVCTFTVNGSYVLAAAMDVSSGGTLVLSTSGTLAGITFGTLSVNSTVNYAGASQTVIGASYRNLSLSGSGTVDLSAVTSVLGNLSLSGSVSVTRTTTLTVSGRTTLSGTTQLILGADDLLSNIGPITLDGGTLKTGATTGYTDKVGTLTLSNNSTIALGTGVHSLTFLASSGLTWTAGKALTITGWTGGYNGTSGTGGQVFVSSFASGLTAAQVAQIQFYNGSTYYPATILSTGEVVPTAAINYYSKASGALNLTSTWTSDITLATTVSPANFTTANQIFNVRNQASPTIAASWLVSGTGSKIVVGDGSTAINFTVPAGMRLTGPVDISAKGTMTLLNVTAGELAFISFGTLNISSTVNYGGSGAQTVNAVSYGNLTLSGSGAKTLTGVSAIYGNFTLSGSATATAANSMYFGGTVTLGSGTTFTAGAFTHNVAGDWTNNGGTFTNTGSTLNFNNTISDQNINGTAATQTFNNMTIAKSLTTVHIGGSTTMLTINNTLTMTHGNIDCGTAATMQLGTGTSSVGTLNYTAGNIAGKFMRWFNSTVGGKTFPLGPYSASGTSVARCNALITFTNLTSGSLTGNFLGGDPANNGLPLTESSINIVNTFATGYWSFVAANSLASTNYAIELTGTDFGPYNFTSNVRILKRVNNTSAWTLNGTHVAAVGNTAKRSGLSGFSEFGLGSVCADAVAGPDQQVYTFPNATFTMAATLPGGSTGAWTLLSGSANITTPTSPTTTVTGVGAGESAILRWTVTTGSCVSFDDIEILNELNKDLPNPDPHIVTAPAGTWVIAMDNTLQASPGYFNIKSYGLIVNILNNLTPVHWIIRAGKPHDGTDFTAMASQIFPTSGAAASRDFKGGPYLIHPHDTTGLRTIVNTFNSALTNKVNIYQLTSATQVDERYILIQKPKVALLDDGGNADVLSQYMVNASVPTDNYSVLTTAANLDAECYTFAAEPHSAAVSSVLDSIHAYCSRGGNFLGQCLAVNTYENNTSGHFQTSNGWTILNVDLEPNYSFPNADLALGQYQGIFDAMLLGGAEKNWRLNPNSEFINHAYTTMTGSGSQANVIGQSVSKLGIGPGHMVSFVGAHNYDGTTVSELNGMRSFFNAMLTPSALTKCNFLSFQIDLGIVKTVNRPDIYLTGDGNVVFTVVVKHNGPYTGDAVDFTIKDIFPYTGFNMVGTPTVSTGTYDPLTDTWTIPLLAFGASATMTLEASPIAVGTYTNTAKIDPPYPQDGNPSNDISGATVTVHADPFLLYVSATPVSCAENSDGAVDLTVSGGTPPFHYIWSNGATTEDISGLTAGTYTVTVSDDYSNSKHISAVVTGPLTPVSASIISKTNVSCNGMADGNATVSASGGTPGYTYKWSTTPEQTTVTATGLSAGTYTVTVSDSHGCTATTQAVITQPNEQLTASIIARDHVSCAGYTDGTATVSASGGTPVYTYKWSTIPEQTSITASGLGSGTYTVTVTDSHGCSTTTQATITEPTQLVITDKQITHVKCTGDLSGSIAISVDGGTPSYTFLWSNSATTQNLTNVFAGTYTVTVTDNHGCTTSTWGTITEPASLPQYQAVITNVACKSVCTGAIDVTPLGGTPGYSYNWSNGSTDQNLTGLCAGLYVLTLTDSKGCKAISSNTVTEPLNFLEVFNNITHVNCNGGTGSISLTVTGGTPFGSSPYYQFNWSSGATTQNLGPVSAGTYSVTVTDSHGCTTTTSGTITEPTVLQITNMQVTPVNCFGGDGGLIDLSVSGGTPFGGFSPGISYNYLWSNGSTTEDIGPVAAGTYTVTVTDTHGCTTSGAATITEPPVLESGISAINHVNCYGESNGSATVTASGGTPSYTYKWSTVPEQTLATATGLAAGTYTVTVTDNHGCATTSEATITEPPVLVSGISAKSHVNCNGESNGSATVTGDGGTPSYTYKWNTVPEQLSSTATGLSAGTYTVTVTDSHGCTTSSEATITEPPVLQITGKQITHVNCNGGTGSIDLTVSGGTPAYGYVWSNGTTAQNLGPVSAGTYSVTVTDSHGCTTTTTGTITEPPVLQIADKQITHVNCNGGTGSIVLTVTGGTPTYGYVWSNGSTVQNLGPVAAGTYTVTVTDNHGCTTTTSGTITEPTLLQITDKQITHVRCTDNPSSGSISITVSGGTPSYSYIWSNGSTNQNLSPIGAGTYTVTVSDSHGCTTTTSGTVTQPSVVEITGKQITHVNCNGGTGSIALTVSGGTPAYGYVWSNGSTSQNLGPVAAGTYTVTVTDSHGCATTTSGTITEPPVLQITGKQITHVNCNGGTGSIALTVSGGTPTYGYVWSNGSTAQNLGPVAAGTYTVTVTDSHGCTTTTSGTITEPPLLQITDKQITHVNCNGGTGSIALTVSGGTPTYGYVWSNGSTAQNLGPVAAGAYSVTVTDSHGCTTTTSGTITEPPVLQITGKQITHVNCNGGTGSIALTVSGGTPTYGYVWSNGSTAQNLGPVAAGTYSVTVTDSHGCTTTTSGTITEPPVLQIADKQITHVNCNGGTGSIALTVSGGTPTYGYVWSNGSTAQNLGPVAAGTYSVTVTDSHGCTTTTSGTITEPPVLQITGKQITHVNCNGGTGSIALTVSGGTPTYGYVWSSGATTQNLGPVAAGTYTVTVTDSHGCTTTTSGTITEPPVLQISGKQITHVNCNGGTGSIALTVSGGTPTYGYVWSNGSTAQNLGPVAAGTYSVTVTDSHGCTTTTSGTITEPPVLQITGKQITHVNCNGGTGSIALTVSGGTPTYGYVWSNGSTAQNLGPVAAGTYSVTVTDSHGCTTTTSGTITEPPVLVSGISAVNSVNCNGGFNGSATVTANGGTPSYTYKWSTVPEQTSATATGLGAGTYTVTVTDSHGCTTSSQATITEPPVLISGISASTDVNCNGEHNGTATVTADGGTPIYTYTWNTIPEQTTETATGLGAGTYTVTVTDSHGCTTTSQVTITEPPVLSVLVTTVGASCGITNGEVHTEVNGGTPDYTYSWNTGATTDVLMGVGAGTYTVTVTDSHGCTTTGSGTVTSPDNWIPCLTGPDSVCQGSVATYCVCLEDQLAHPGSQYQWTIIGGTILSACCGPCVTIRWADNCTTGRICVQVTSPDPANASCTGYACMDITVKIMPKPVITGPTIVTTGQSGAQYCTPNAEGHLYSWAVSGGTVTSGQGTNCITITWGTSCQSCTGQIIVYEWFDGCCGTDTLDVTILPGEGNLTGYIRYDNLYSTGLNGVQVKLYTGSDVLVSTVVTGPNQGSANEPGYFTFSNIPDGTYHLRASFDGLFGGNNATDALIIQLNIIGAYPLSPLRYHAADVNASMTNTAVDALYVKLRTVGMINSYPAGDWILGDTTFTLSGSAFLSMKGLCFGDVNGSYIPTGLKETSTIGESTGESMAINVNEPFTYSVRSVGSSELGALTLFLGYDPALFTIEGISSSLEGMKYRINGDRVSIAWAETEPVNLTENSPFLTFKVRAKTQISAPTRVFSVLGGSEAANRSAIPTTDLTLTMQGVYMADIAEGIMLTNYPNPFTATTTIEYSIPESGKVSLVISDVYGKVVRNLIGERQDRGTHVVSFDAQLSSLNPGAYMCRLIVEGDQKTYSAVRKLILIK